MVFALWLDDRCWLYIIRIKFYLIAVPLTGEDRMCVINQILFALRFRMWCIDKLKWIIVWYDLINDYWLLFDWCQGLLIAVPIPDEYQADGQVIETAIQEALVEASRRNIRGKDVTPFVLSQVNELTKGASLMSSKHDYFCIHFPLSYSDAGLSSARYDFIPLATSMPPVQIGNNQVDLFEWSIWLRLSLADMCALPCSHSFALNWFQYWEDRM